MYLLLTRRMVSVTALIATIALLVVASTPAPVQATAYSCQQAGTCPNQASCEGTNYTRDGCTIQCLVPVDNSSGELANAGSATCGSSGGGGGNDGGGDWWCGTYCW
jgi:hypothetical protein